MLLNEIEPKFNFVASMARSHDSFHMKNQIIHLILSGIITGPLPPLEDLNPPFAFDFNSSDKILLIKIVNVWGRLICNEGEQINEFITVNTYSLGYLFKNKNNLKNLERTFEQVFGKRDSIRETTGLNNYDVISKISKYKQGNVFFIFENLHWYNIKHLFNFTIISISGGSQSKRHLLSVTQFNLINFITMIDSSPQNILSLTEKTFLSNNISKELKKGKKYYNDKFICLLYSETMDELIGSITEIEILVRFLEAEINNLLVAYATSDVSSSAGFATSSVRYNEDKKNKNTAISDEDKITKYKNMISDLNSIKLVNAEIFNYFSETFDAL